MNYLQAASAGIRNLRSGASRKSDGHPKVSDNEYGTHLLPTSNSVYGTHSTSSSTSLYGTGMLPSPDILEYGNQEGQELGEGQESMSKKQRGTSSERVLNNWKSRMTDALKNVTHQN